MIVMVRNSIERLDSPAAANVRKRKVQKIFQQKEACKSPSMRRIVVPDQSVPLPQVEEDYVPPERKGVTVALGRKRKVSMPERKV